MNQRTLVRITLTLGVVSIALWCLVYFTWRTISEDMRAHAEVVAGAAQQSVRDSSIVRVHALLGETKSERENLESRTQADVVSIVEMIERVGVDAGVRVQISNAVPEKISQDNAMSVLSFIVQSNGSFAEVTKVVSLLSTISLPSSLEEITFDRNSGDWALSARVRVFTSSAISL